MAAVDGPDAQSALDYCTENALELTHILNTHTHGDHIGINRELNKMGMLNQVTVIGSLHAPSPYSWLDSLSR